MRSNTELARLMAEGLKMEKVREEKKYLVSYVDGCFFVCALGAALVGLYGDPLKAYKAVEDATQGTIVNRTKAASELLDIDPELVEFIDLEHIKGTPVSTIILFLEATDAFRKAEGI